MVDPSRFDTRELTLKQPERLGFTTLNADWPRSGHLIQDDELVPVETVGKLRLRIRAPGGKTAANVPFRVTGCDRETGSEATLRQSVADGQGYAAVNPGDIEADRLAGC